MQASTSTKVDKGKPISDWVTLKVVDPFHLT